MSMPPLKRMTIRATTAIRSTVRTGTSAYRLGKRSETNAATTRKTAGCGIGIHPVSRVESTASVTPAPRARRMAAKSVISVMTPGSGEKAQEDQAADHQSDAGPLRPSWALVEEHDAEDDRDHRVRSRSGGDNGGVRMPDAEVEGDIAKSVDDCDQRDRGEESRRAVGKAPLATAQRDADEEERRESSGEEDGDEPAVGRAEVRDPGDEHADRDRGDEGEQDPEERDPLVRPELGEVGRRQQHAEHHDDDRERLPRSEPLASDQDGANDRGRRIGRDDRAHDRDRADGERPVEAKVGQRAESSEEEEQTQADPLHVTE